MLLQIGGANPPAPNKYRGKEVKHMSTLNKVLEALLQYDATMQVAKDTAEPDKKADIEIERQSFYSYIAGFAAGSVK